MPGFEFIKGQNQPLEILSVLISKGAVPHGMLFIGINGIGKRTTALALAKALNCTHSRNEEPGPEVYHTAIPCGICKQCKKIESGVHPDIYFLEPQGQFIKVDRIRDLIANLAMKPFEAEVRVVVISDAMAMNVQAQNALLKVLEEPPPRTIIILTATNTTDLLPTISSRCQQIQFAPLSKNFIEKKLCNDYGIDAKAAIIIAEIAEGSLDKAVLMAKKGWINFRDLVISGLEDAQEGSSGIRMSLALKLSAKRDTAVNALDVTASWLRDLMVIKYDPERITNKDWMERLERLSEKAEEKTILNGLEAVYETRKRIEGNANTRLAMEVFILKLFGQGWIK